MKLKDLVRQAQVTWLKWKCRQQKDLRPEGRVLILAPHPDDEVFGCGGLIARLCSNGNAPYVVVLTGGGGSHRGCCDVSEPDIAEARRELTRKAMSYLGLPPEHLFQLDLKDGSIAECYSAYNCRNEIKNVIDQVNPDIIFVPHHAEGWPDHIAVREIGLKLAPANAVIWEYCVWFWYYMQRHINWSNARSFKMTDEEHAAKLSAIDIYHTAYAPCKRPWVGVLPPLFVKANSTSIELYFKVR